MHLYVAIYQGGALVGDFARVEINLANDVDALKHRIKASWTRLHAVDIVDMTVFGPWAVKPRRIEVAPLVDEDKEPCDPTAILGAVIGDKECAFFIVRVTAPFPAVASGALGIAIMGLFFSRARDTASNPEVAHSPSRPSRRKPAALRNEGF